MPTDKAGRVIFIGNIPYGLAEEQIVHLFSSAGEVLNFRLVHDKETGRPKGFGFAEFADADSAASAVRNLNGYEMNGRTLRVDYSNEDGVKDPAPTQQQAPVQQPQFSFPQQSQYQQPQQQNGIDLKQQTQQSNVLPPMPPGVDLPPNVSCPDAISQTLNQVPPPQLLDAISQLKGLITTDPRQAVYILAAKPQLAYAVFQALLLLGLVDTNALGQVVQTDNQPQQQQQQQQQQLPFQPPPPQPYAQQPPMPPQFAPQFQQPMNMSTPPTHNQPYRAPPAPQKPPDITDFQWEQLRAICNLPQAQVDSMTNPTERNTVLQIRQQWGPTFAGQFTGVPGY